MSNENNTRYNILKRIPLVKQNQFPANMSQRQLSYTRLETDPYRLKKFTQLSQSNLQVRQPHSLVLRGIRRQCACALLW